MNSAIGYRDLFRLIWKIGDTISRGQIYIFLANAGEAVVCAASNFDPSVLTTKEYYLESGEVKISGLALDAVAILPVIGVLKNIKYVDDVVDCAKVAGNAADTVFDIAKNVDMAADVSDNIHDTAKAVDALDSVSDTAKAADSMGDAAKAADLVDDAVDAGKDFAKMPLDELPEKIQELYPP